MYDARTSLHRGNDPRPIARPGRADQGRLPAGTKVGLIVVGALIALGIAFGALAQPPAGADPNSELGHWFNSLRQPDTGVSCCGVADGHQVDYRIAGDHYEVWYDQKWIAIPKKFVINTMNPTGRGVVFLGPDETVYCFVPGTEA